MPKPDAELTYIRAVNAALKWALETYPGVVVFGEDVAIPGGPFGASKGLRNEFGERVFDTPISEAAMVGAALGMAVEGMRPIVEVMYGDFLLVAMDQIVNQVANAAFVSAGRQRAQLVIRTQHGATPGSCAQHSQSLEALFAHVPGLLVGMPATPDDAYQMLRSAIVSDEPVLIMESRRLYPSKGIVRLGVDVEPIGGAREVRTGRDLTIVAWGTQVQPCLAAADQLGAEGVEATVVDLRWATPMDAEAVARSVAGTSRLLVVHEASKSVGLGAEVIASVAEALNGQPLATARVAMPDLPVPAAPALSAPLLPSVTSIAQAARDLMRVSLGGSHYEQELHS